MKRVTAWCMAFSLVLLCAFPVRAEMIGGGREGTAEQTQEPQTGAAGKSFVDASNATAVAEQPQAGREAATATPTLTPQPVGSSMPGNSAQPVGSSTPGTSSQPVASSIPDTSSQPDESPTPSAAPTPSASPVSGEGPSPQISPSPEGSPSPETSPSPEISPTPSVSPSASPSVEGLENSLMSTQADGEGPDWNNENAPSNVSGGIEVILRNVLPTEGIVLNVWLEKDGQAAGDTRQVQLEKSAKGRSEIFEGLDEGTYSLKITGPGFIQYKQDIEVVRGSVQSIEIHTGFVNLEGFSSDPDFSYDTEHPHPGVLLIGDVNGDNILDDQDKDAIMSAMSRGENGALVGDPDQNPTDLDRDGKTDLVDLQYYVNSKARLDEGKHTRAPLSSAIMPEAVKVNLSPQTTVSGGSVEELLKDNENMVSLQNADGTEISGTNPVELGFNLQSAEQEEQNQCAFMEHVVISMGESSIENGIFYYEDQNGEWKPIYIVDGKQADAAMAYALPSESERAARAGRSGELVIDLGGQVAVKKVELRITGTKNKNLAQISKVEFLNGMKNRIPEPKTDIPTGLSAEEGDQSFILKWNKAENITGYEVKITCNGQSETVRAAAESLEVKSFQGNKLSNGTAYEVCVQSVNGNWQSGYGSAITVTPEVSKVPDAPDNLKATGGYCVVRMSWKNMKNTNTYNVYYREAGEEAFTRVEGIARNSYEITGLKEKTRYEVYVTGVNSLGEGSRSIISEAVTTTLIPAKMPNYKLINESNGKGKLSAHIVSATHARGTMVASPLDTAGKSALGTVDKDFGSSYQILDWDDGAAYVSPDKGLLFTLDDYYQMSYITFAETEDIASYSQVSVYYYDKEHPDGVYAENPVVLQRSDSNGRKYYLIKLAEPITANKVRLGFARGYNLYNIVIAEVNFYHYDSLEDDILALYENDLQTSLREGVTEETINELQKRLDSVDEKSGEYHPERAVLQRELDNARGLLEHGFNDVIEIKPQITARRDAHLGFSGLNAWQPLGITAYEGEQIVIYVGHNQLKTGSNSALKLIATQYHAEAGAFASEVASLKVGRNEITIPAIQSLACEGGGALYIQYTGDNGNDRYAVRVNGGVKEPVLDLYGVTDEAERLERVSAYVGELEEHVASQEALHREKHETAGEGNKVNRAYDKQNCILGATEIMLDQMMLSVSAEQILAGLGSGSTQEKAARLNQSLRAMDEMLELFYHHKGLSDDPSAPATDRMPAAHLNIRYMRMFAGAFMYASGNHIGIEWGSVPGLATSVPVQSENGKYLSGNYFGWGIAHEIGHNINQGSYAIAEVTNNYFAVLAQAKDRNDSVRFQYKDVYKKVTSNTVGHPSNVFTHLAMYWQLHLAYDRGYNYKIYDSYQEQQENLFYARVDSYSRNTSLAPGNLNLNGGSDQNIMRLACAAAGRNLTEFFMRWGLVPDQETSSYAGQFPKEERALYYLTDDARVYEIERGGTQGTIRGDNVIGSSSSVSVSESVANEVNLTIECTANPDVILGYEIARYCYEDGESVRQVIGFSTENTWQDHVAVVNNRVMTYEVTAVDKFGYRSNPATIGEVKISHDGSHDKSMWTAASNLHSQEDTAQEAWENDPCAPETVSAISRIIDNDYNNTYTGMVQGGDATVLLRLNQVLSVCGLKYTVDSGTVIGNYEIQVSVDGSTWTTVKTGSFDDKKGSQSVYFENGKDPWVCTYDAAYVRLKAPGQTEISISEIDLLGPAGDDISFGAKEDGTQGAVGILAEDYVYEQKDGVENYIPKGSLIFTGSYKGNPAYNVVVLYDESGSVVGGVEESGALKSSQIILANVPENGLLGEVSRGTWIYWIEPSAQGELSVPGGKIRAQLYRVDNAITNEGQRLVSDTLPLVMPEKDRLPEITLKNEVKK